MQNIPAGVDPDGIGDCGALGLGCAGAGFRRRGKILTNFPLDTFPNAGDAPKTFHQGRIALARGGAESAGRYFAAAAPDIEEWVREDFDDPDRHTQLALLYAYMQRKEDAVREARRAIEMEPKDQNAFHGATRAGTLALVCALTGETEEAITLIERLLSTPGPVAWPDFPSNITLADLRLRWEWDSLRSNPRFQKILAGPEPKTDLTPIQPPASAAPEKSIAVLPFENLSDDKQNAYFVVGMQDEVMTNLARIADLRVISRTSVMQYPSGAPRNLREIGEALGVNHVVEGSVQRVANRVRVNAQLIDARTDAHLWAETYDRDLADVFGIQSEIAQKIGGELRAKLSPNEKLAIAERPTADLQAYELYNEARAIDVWEDRRGAEKSMARKVELLEQATQRDPSFVLAWCALAKTQCDLADNLDPTHLKLARKAANTALRLRPDLGEVHRELARYYYYENDFAHAYEELTVALRTLPNDSETFRIAAETDRHRNCWDEALANFQKARALDPRNDEVSYHLSGLYEDMRRYDEWEQLQTKADANQSGPNPWSEMARAQIKLDKGDPIAAQALLTKVPLDFSPTNEIWCTRLTTALYLRDYEASSRVLAAAPAKFDVGVLHGLATESVPIELLAEGWAAGLVARFRGDTAKAEAVFAAARKKFAAVWGERDKNHRYFARLAALDAGLGRKQQAIEEARRAVDLMPIATDSARGPWVVRNLAMVYAWTGERDLALEQLEIVAKTPAGPHYGELRFDPTWDPLRGDPRFEKIVASIAPKL